MPDDCAALDVQGRTFLVRTLGVPAYDFDPRPYFPCRSLRPDEERTGVIARIGALVDYDATYAVLEERGLRLVNDPEQHRVASTLSGWYPALESLTPRSVVFETFPSNEAVARSVGFPVFVKGDRQTHAHRASTTSARDAAALDLLRRAWFEDPVLCWQPVAVRELVALEPLAVTHVGDRVPPSVELRAFFLEGRLVGFGPYWWAHADAMPTNLDGARALAEEAARRVDVPFLVVDVARRDDGRWIVIECNDGQEAGHAGIRPLALWSAIVTAS
jgi:hypothetical protein